jgi:hypothetical protein
MGITNRVVMHAAVQSHTQIEVGTMPLHIQSGMNIFISVVVLTMIRWVLAPMPSSISLWGNTPPHF